MVDDDTVPASTVIVLAEVLHSRQEVSTSAANMLVPFLSFL